MPESLLAVEKERDWLVTEGGMRDGRKVATDANINRLALLKSR